MNLRIRAAALLAAAPLILAALTASPASAATPAGSAYGYHFDQAEAWVSGSGSSVFPTLHSTGTAYQVWINGGLACQRYNGAQVSWCGLSGNGTWRLVVGANFTDAYGRAFYIRMALYAGAYGNTCSAWGDATSDFVTYCYS